MIIFYYLGQAMNGYGTC